MSTRWELLICELLVKIRYWIFILSCVWTFLLARCEHVNLSLTLQQSGHGAVIVSRSGDKVLPSDTCYVLYDVYTGSTTHTCISPSTAARSFREVIDTAALLGSVWISVALRCHQWARVPLRGGLWRVTDWSEAIRHTALGDEYSSGTRDGSSAAQCHSIWFIISLSICPPGCFSLSLFLSPSLSLSASLCLVSGHIGCCRWHAPSLRMCSMRCCEVRVARGC